MGFMKKLFGWDFMDKEEKEAFCDVVSIDEATAQMLATRNLAFEMCVQRVAKAISKCEFLVYQKGRLNKKHDWYYLLNVRPNANENATEFWEKFIHKLYYDGEVLMIMEREMLFIADSFQRDTTKVFKAQTFSNVSIGEMNLKKVYTMDNVFYFKLNNSQITNYLNDSLAMLLSLMLYASDSYMQSNGARYKLRIDRPLENKDKKDENYKEKQEKKMRDFLKNPRSIWLETKGTEMTQMEGKGTIKDTRDVKALFNDVLEITSKAFLIPTNIAAGEVTDTSKAVQDFLTFCLDSIVQLIQDGLNAKKWTPQEYKDGSRIKINTQRIEHISIISMAQSLEHLISSGLFSVNMVLGYLLDIFEIDEDWANQHFMTKNYSSIDELLEQKGGDGNENTNDESGNENQSQKGNTGRPGHF